MSGIQVACVACGSEVLRLVGFAPIIDPNLSETFAIKECAICGHWLTEVDVTPEFLGGLYALGSPSVLGEGAELSYTEGAENLEVASDKNWIVERLHDEIPSNFLEVGPGGGSLIRKFRLLGWNVYGVDPGQYFNDAKIVPSVNALPQGELFDVAVLKDILEHTANPWTELQQYASLLAPGAKIFMTFPWSESREAKKMGSAWTMVRPIGHLHYFSKKSADLLLQSIGAECVSMQIIHTVPSMSQQFKNIAWLVSTFPFQFLRRKVRKHPYRQRIDLLYQSWVSLRSEGDQLYVEGRAGKTA